MYKKTKNKKKAIKKIKLTKNEQSVKLRVSSRCYLNGLLLLFSFLFAALILLCFKDFLFVFGFDSECESFNCNSFHSQVILRYC